MSKLLHFHFRHNEYLFTFRIGFFLLCLGFFSLFCLLGSWQLHRYHYKKDLLLTYQSRLNAKPISFVLLRDNKVQKNLSPILHIEKDRRADTFKKQSLNDMQFQVVRVEGQYVNNLIMLVQNIKYNDQMGFEVLTPLQIAGERKLLLIDRGWIPAAKNQNLPEIRPTSELQHITGYIKLLNEHQFILGKNILYPAMSPMIMQRIDIEEIAQLTHEAFYPFILRLNAKEMHGFIRDWTVSTSLPQRHMGYAVQWFAMALVLLIAYLSFCIERVKDHANKS